MNSTVRRSRFAPSLLLLLALVVTCAIYAFMPRAGAADGTGDVAEGTDLFRANCATCHGTDGQGTDIGPALIGVGAAAVDFQMSTGRMPLAQQAVQAPSVPVQFTDDQIAAISAYVASLGPGPSIPAADAVDGSQGDAANGMLLFRTNCAMCHNAVGAGGALSEGKYAPSLFNTDPTQIYEAMLTGPQAMPVFNDSSVTPEEKRDIIAYLEAQREVSPSGLTLGSLGPVSEALWVWIIGIGSLIGIAVWLGARSA